jgi:hypothetical protein
MRENIITYPRYCENCNLVQDMFYVGPAFCESGLNRLPEPEKIKDIRLYTCSGCHSTFSFPEPQIRTTHDY